MPTKNKMDFQKIQTLFFLLSITVFSIAVLFIFQPFFYPIFWAAVLAILFYPIYIWFEKYLKLRSFSSFATVVFVTAIVFIPLWIIILLVINESSNLYTHLSNSNLFGSVESWSRYAQNIPFVGQYFDNAGVQSSLYATNVAKNISLFLFENLKSIAQNSIRFFALFVVTLYTLFYFFKDGKRMLTRLMHLCPLGDEYESMLYTRFTSTARATIKGTIIIGMIQGSIGGLLFWATGIPGALVWGILMICLSLVPGVGAAIIWFPTALIMMSIGHLWEGIAILLVGTFIISLIDNLLRPLLVGKDTQMHPVLILFSTLGGIAFFGISGFILGPVITALFLSVISIYEHYYKKELKNN
jgi:predicted PurR-regulated permease PerM